MWAKFRERETDREDWKTPLNKYMAQTGSNPSKKQTNFVRFMKEFFDVKLFNLIWVNSLIIITRIRQPFGNYWAKLVIWLMILDTHVNQMDGPIVFLFDGDSRVLLPEVMSESSAIGLALISCESQSVHNLYF
jgi:hypothetical protein